MFFFVLVRKSFFYIKHRNARPTQQFPSFKEWYKHTFHKAAERIGAFTDTPPIYTYEYYSPTLLIDTIYRSMQGPLSAETVYLRKNNNRLLNFLEGRSGVYSDSHVCILLPDTFQFLHVYLQHGLFGTQRHCGTFSYNCCAGCKETDLGPIDVYDQPKCLLPRYRTPSRIILHFPLPFDASRSFSC